MSWDDEIRRDILQVIIGDQQELWERSAPFRAWTINKLNEITREMEVAAAEREALAPVFEAASRDHDERVKLIETTSFPKVLLCGDCPKLEGITR